MGNIKDIASIRSKASGMIKAIRRNSTLDYADILPILDPTNVLGFGLNSTVKR
jgi:hypothetical protein